ncbi:hypothetical protein ILUMI_06359 [Ignelater luminosus]|uniref:Uncharacterized protein n=1 Tax=Ignelater luminosus TaxID=2038154 RepID=A0A8K0DB86_IGNLU|nr:hypothetical protein ILUMI_06359 [Ignelater luminosus]
MTNSNPEVTADDPVKDDATVLEEITTTTYLGIYISDLHENTQQEDCDHVFDDLNTEWTHRTMSFVEGFKPPATNTCDMCDKDQMLLKEASDVNQRTSVQEKYEKHLAKAQQRYQTKKADKETAKQNDYQKVEMVDLEKCLPSPVLTNSQSFYGLKLWSFNYTIYDANEKVVNCMMWDESLAGCGRNEMSSCMLKYSVNDPLITHLIVLSDNCPSQNRNVQMIMCYFHILRTVPHLKTDFDETSEFETVDYNRKVSRNNTIYDDLNQVTEDKHPISKKKYDDLQKLMVWIPKRFHQFYKDLRYE